MHHLSRKPIVPGGNPGSAMNVYYRCNVEQISEACPDFTYSPITWGCQRWKDWWVCMHVKSLWSCPALCGPPGSSVHGFSSQEHWSGLPCPPPGDLPNPGIKPESLISPALAGRFFTTRATWEALGWVHVCPNALPPRVPQTQASSVTRPSFSLPLCLRGYCTSFSFCFTACSSDFHFLSPDLYKLSLPSLTSKHSGEYCLGHVTNSQFKGWADAMYDLLCLMPLK